MRKIVIENKSIAEAIDWVKKYFKAASVENKFLDFNIKGIKERRLISNPIHILNQEEAEIEINVPNNIEKKNNIL